MTNVRCDGCGKEGPVWGNGVLLARWVARTGWELLDGGEDGSVLLCPTCQPREDEDRETVAPGDEYHYHPPGAVDR